MTRRHFLAGLSLPLLPLHAAPPNPASLTILPEGHLLSQESAAAYSELLPMLSPPRRSVLLLPGAKQLSLARALAIRRTLEAGASVLIECGLAFSASSEIEEQRRVLHRAFGIQLGSPAAVANPHHPYVAFAPGTLVRPFGLTIPVFRDGGEALAHFGETPVALKARVGSGTLIFLGAMLGPHIQAADSDARFAVIGLLSNLSS